MNDVYFACQTCKNYIDAGYRWCYWTLERPGIVERGKPVDLNAVRNAGEYWQGAEEAQWLRALLPNVRAFLEQHQMHELLYGEAEDFGAVPMFDEDVRFLDWMNEDGFVVELLPRYFVERLHFSSWRQVEAYVAKRDLPPWWWDLADLRHKAKVRFVCAVHGIDSVMEPVERFDG